MANVLRVAFAALFIDGEMIGNFNAMIYLQRKIFPKPLYFFDDF
ncbi:hypothetical protein EJK55_1867 [Moraxella catarrhalis]|uniref:Uncharacterized protein n=1 Tax=Moraxella catarrhalis TaxID=480 RepID=A0A3Q9GD98_MORCA|nr:hypothetical protein EJK50_1439 [Moraxella catarrhalis]AZQ93177.1 hypothetical protein EJK53_1450 [Moraxella catarrhalis]AZQ94817.1 hypothetical protein EJK48_1463 [Moraxella catarrhalis]RUO12597.1 hypothetical protein EJK49_0574 [Moraxella catarrhalis]RUO16334.1 hypothetical protein EJK55_1867 [Moraxella catarrhalis]